LPFLQASEAKVLVLNNLTAQSHLSIRTSVFIFFVFTFCVLRSVFRVPCSAFSVQRSVFRVQRSAFRVPRSVFFVLCSLFFVLCSLFLVLGSWFLVLCFWYGILINQLNQLFKWSIRHPVFTGLFKRGTRNVERGTRNAER